MTLPSVLEDYPDLRLFLAFLPATLRGPHQRKEDRH
jgi:hypothetical protein